MPLVVMCGYPSSGKSEWSDKLTSFFIVKGHEVVVVREQDHFRGEKNSILDDSRQEKELRAKVKSEVQRTLTKDNVVIMDALNYIKGYRYELFCMSKAIPTKQVTVQCDISKEVAWQWNISREEGLQYKKEVFDHLISRFELPDSRNRWDSPFFSVIAGEELDLLGIYESLFQSKRIVKQNQSTQNKPVSESNFLPSLEKVTSDIVQAILLEQKKKSEDEEPKLEFAVPHAQTKINFNFEQVTLTQLTKLKRQFMSLTKTGSSHVKGDDGELFVHYLNSQLNSDQ